MRTLQQTILLPGAMVLVLEYYKSTNEFSGTQEVPSWNRRRKGRQRMRFLNDIIDTMDMNLNKLQETVKDREPWHAAVRRATKNQT